MKTDLYTKIILTVIALLLSGILTEMALVPKDVRLVAIIHPPPKDRVAHYKLSKEDLWSTIDIDGSVDVSGSVDIDNEVEVKPSGFEKGIKVEVVNPSYDLVQVEINR